jgi:hypothetical protein
MTDCPICKLPVRSADLGIYDCLRCGEFEFGTGGGVSLGKALTDVGPQARRRANLSHQVRRRTRKGESHVFFEVAELDRWGLDDPLPSPTELLEQMILWVGDNQPAVDEGVLADKLELSAWLGLPIGKTPNRFFDPIEWLFSSEELRRFVLPSQRESGKSLLQLTWDGWERYDALKRQDVASFTAFMAMSFRDPEVMDVVDTHFKPAVAATGFTLRRVTDGQGAGLIDDQMRVGLRTSRFVVADLTHTSPGAYWEGGFAEGLGKPVIYTCRRDHWDAEKTHFDTNHLATVIWDPADIGKAMAALKAMIRNTLPDVAKMED